MSILISLAGNLKVRFSFVFVNDGLMASL